MIYHELKRSKNIMKQEYKKPQVEAIIPFPELLTDITESGSGDGPGVSGKDDKGSPGLDAKPGRLFSVWDVEEDSDDAWK